MDRVARSLEVDGFEVVVTREPGATDLGARLRELLLHGEDVSSRAELFLYLADRAEHVETVIKPALAAGKLVLCDRFSDSTIAYQGYGRDLDLDAVKKACRFAQDIDVDLTILLDLDPREGLERAGRRGEQPDRLESESLAFHERVREGFLELAGEEPDRFEVLDAGLSPDELSAQVLTILRTHTS